MSGDTPWKWRRPERATPSPLPSSPSSRAPLSSHDVAPPPHFPAFLPYKSPPPSHPQRHRRVSATENAAPRTPSSAGPVPRDADRALILRDIVDGGFAHACSLTPHRTPARSTSELAYLAPAPTSTRTAERELVAVAAFADRAAARVAEEDPIARERALALRQSQLARLRADARDDEASRVAAAARAEADREVAERRRAETADAARAAEAAEAARARVAVAASVADAEARRRYRASRDAFKLEARAFRGDPYDATLGPGLGPAARARDRRRVAEEVDAAYRRCAACDRGEPHALRACDFALGLSLGAADRPLRPAEERLSGVEGGATVIEAIRRGGNAALFDAATWRASASAATRAGANPSAPDSAPDSAPGAESDAARRLARTLADARGSSLVDAALADADDAAADRLTSLTLRSRRLTTFPRLPPRARRLRSITLTRNDIADVPDGIAASAPALAALDLSRNALRGTLRASVAELSRLTALRLDDNAALVALPASLGRLAALRELSVARCGLTSLPAGISSCVELRVLDVTGNQLRALPCGLFSRTSRLRELWARDNALASLPPTLADAARLKRLDVGGNRLETFPDVSRLVRLETLACARNRLVVAPPGLGPGCASLEVLDLDGNRLTTLGASDDGVASLPKLRTLKARGNRVETIGCALGRSESLAGALVHVDLRGNRLRAVPASVGRLHALRRLLLFDDDRDAGDARKDETARGEGGATRDRTARDDDRRETRGWSDGGFGLGPSARRVFAPRSLADGLDFLERVDVELTECDDWSPGLRDACGVEGDANGRVNANGRGGGIVRRRSVSAFWPGAASRGGVSAPLDGGPGLGGVGRENARDGASSFKSKSKAADAILSAFKVKDERRAAFFASEWKPREANEGDVASRRLARGSELDRVQASTLARAPVFEAMSPRDTRILADGGGYVVRSYAPGAPVMTKGDEREESLAMFVILRGAAEILKTDGESNEANAKVNANADLSNSNPTSTTDSAFASLRRALATRVARAGRPVTFGSSGDRSDGRRLVVSGVLLPGDAFGESCLLTGAPHPDDVRAGPEGVETLALTRDAAELAFVNSPGLAAAVARRAACRHVLAAAAYDASSSVALDPAKDVDARRRVSDVAGSDVEREAVRAVGEEGVAAVARRLLAAMDVRFRKRAEDAPESADGWKGSKGSTSTSKTSTTSTSTSKSTSTAALLWARARRTFFVERWRRRVHGLDVLRCFTAEETRDVLRRGASEIRLETGRKVVREGDDAGVPSLIVVTRGSLSVFMRSRVTRRRPDGASTVERREIPILDAARLSYSGGTLPIGSRSGAALSPAFAPAEAEHIPCGCVLEGGMFGENAALAGGARTRTGVCAERDTEVLLVPGPAFAEAVRRRPSLCDDLARALAWRKAAADASAEAAAKGTRASPEPPSAKEMVALAGKMETLFKAVNA